MKKISMKKMFAMLLVIAMVMQVIPCAVFETNAADTSTTSHEDVVDPTTGIKYVWYEDISEYRTSKPYTYPKEDEYVFAGWFTTSAEDDGNEIGTDVTSGSAWAKFVPEETLTVKGQINRDLSKYDTSSGNSLSEVKLRLSTSVDSLKYQSVGFEVTINGKTTDFPIQKVYDTIVLVDSEHGQKIENAKSIFCDASAHFATITISGIPNGDNNNFENMEIKVVPYWITKDNTRVTGISRNRMLISDERVNDEDGSSKDFTKLDKTYSYMQDISDDNTASYKYFKGGSDTVYLSGTYTSDGVTENKFGISIRNGGQTRQVFFNGHGIEVVDGVDNNMDTTGYADSSILSTKYNVGTVDDKGVFVWLEDYDAGLSAVSTMLAETESSSHEIIWVIYENTLFCSVDKQITYRIPMENLCSNWQNGRYYQLGVAGFNSAEANGIEFVINTLEVGKKAKNLLALESEGLTVHQMAYEPITGSYVAPTNQSYGKECCAITEFVKPDTAVALETDIEWEPGSGTTAGITIALDDEDSVQFELIGKADARLYDEYEWTNVRYIGKEIGNLVADFSSDTDGKYHVSAAIYDGKFYVLFNGITAYERELKYLFTDANGNITYDGTEKVSIGVATYSSREGTLTQFHNVKTYFGQDAINMKMEDWTYYPSASRNVESYNIETGFADFSLYSNFTLGTSSDVWQITGTMKHDAATHSYRAQGFGLSDGTSYLRIFGVGSGFSYDTTALAGWKELVETNNAGNTQYAFRPYSGYFNSTAAGSVEFQAIIANNTFYMWLDGEFAWQIPMSALQPAFTTESEFAVNIQHWDSDAKFDNLVVRKGSEVDATLVKTMKSCNNLDWLAAKDNYTVTKDGKIVLDETKTNVWHGVPIYSKEASDTVYMSGTYTNAIQTAANMEAVGVVIKDTSGNARRIDLCGSGFRTSTTETSWGTVNWFNSLDNNYVWAQKGDSELYKVVGSGTSKTADIVWVIQDNTLYCSVNGMISIILPLNVLYEGWTSEASTQYYMALSVYSTQDKKYADISDFTYLYGDDANAMLGDKEDVCSGMTSDVTDMVYDAIDGAYIAKYSGNSAGAYGDADSKVALQTEVQWYDQSTTSGAAGISVKSSTTGKSVEFLLMPNNRTLRKLENLKWDQWQDITLPSDIVPFNENGICNLKAVVNNGTLYLYCNGVEAYQVALSEYLDDYAGEDVKLGIATRNSNEGIAFFRDIKFTTGEAAAALGSVSALADASTTWEVTGTMEQTDLTKLLSQGFKIEAADVEGNKKSITLFGQDAGFVINGDTTYTEYTTANKLIVKIADEAYMNFFSSTARTSKEIDFRLRVVDDTLCVWFEDVLIWNIPLTESTFGGFDAGSAYQISLVIEDDFIGNVFKDVAVITGDDVPILVDLDEDSPTAIGEGSSLSEMSGTITNTSSASKVYLKGSSQTWEITGTMKKQDVDKYIAHGFTVYGRGTDGTMHEQRFYGHYQAYATVRTGGSEWNYSHGNADQVYGFHSTYDYFVSNDSSSPVSEVQFRLVIVDDVLYFFTDGKLSWRVPLTADDLGGFEAGSVYQVGFAFTADEGTTAFENVVAKTGEHADISGVAKFVTLSTTSGMTADQIAGTITVNGSGTDNVTYFRTEESDNRSAKWEIAGTMKRSDIAKWSMLGFAVTDGSTTKYFYGQGAGFVVVNNWKYYTSVNDTTVFSNASVPSFFTYDNVTDNEITFRAVLLEDVLYVYFEGELAWKIPLTDSAFGGFVAGSTYRLGMAQRDAATVYYENLSVKSGNEVRTEADIYIRDPFVLADNYNGVDTYYMYGTRYDGSFDVFTSPDRMVWTKEDPCFVPENDFWGGTANFWAPEVYKYTNPDTNETAYYMFATFLGSETVGDNPGVRGTAILKADSPLGPFTEWSDGAVTLEGHDCLDGTLYIEDGKPYMIYCHEHNCDTCNDGMGSMAYVQLKNDLSGIASNASHTELFEASDYKSSLTVTDGPFVYTVDGKNYLLWSTYDSTYVQIVTPFTSLSEGIDVSSTYELYSDNGGHGMVFTDFGGNDVMVLHTPNSGATRAKFLSINLNEEQ